MTPTVQRRTRVRPWLLAAVAACLVLAIVVALVVWRSTQAPRSVPLTPIPTTETGGRFLWTTVEPAPLSQPRVVRAAAVVERAGSATMCPSPVGPGDMTCDGLAISGVDWRTLPYHGREADGTIWANDVILTFLVDEPAKTYRVQDAMPGRFATILGVPGSPLGTLGTRCDRFVDGPQDLESLRPTGFPVTEGDEPPYWFRDGILTWATGGDLDHELTRATALYQGPLCLARMPRGPDLAELQGVAKWLVTENFAPMEATASVRVAGGVPYIELRTAMSLNTPEGLERLRAAAGPYMENVYVLYSTPALVNL